MALIYVSSYDGTITALRATRASRPASAAAWSLAQVAVTRECGAQPSWLTLDRARATLYCVDEALGQPAGALTSFRVSSSLSSSSSELLASSSEKEGHGSEGVLTFLSRAIHTPSPAMLSCTATAAGGWPWPSSQSASRAPLLSRTGATG